MFKSLVLAASALASALVFAASPVPEGTRMRVLDPSLGTGDWVEGRLKTAKDGCVLVFLDRKSKTGHIAASVAGARKVEMLQGGQWVAAPVSAINASQPQACRGGGDND
ncbi:hypothetical protein [Ramlibacter humi]|uniref:Uncharacterized protein n=1 Tax=Ramlibacter humi TaxID=2530451 RepID=A0A4Z0BQG0_9BURK|nr:hypothetical protein [Ramlibacter humi]TFZ00285.1 hypothetical protein EZ216_14390 [Ramlibacter humi]